MSFTHNKAWARLSVISGKHQLGKDCWPCGSEFLYNCNTFTLTQIQKEIEAHNLNQILRCINRMVLPRRNNDTLARWKGTQTSREGVRYAVQRVHSDTLINYSGYIQAKVHRRSSQDGVRIPLWYLPMLHVWSVNHNGNNHVNMRCIAKMCEAIILVMAFEGLHCRNPGGKGGGGFDSEALLQFVYCCLNLFVWPWLISLRRKWSFPSKWNSSQPCEATLLA